MPVGWRRRTGLLDQQMFVIQVEPRCTKNFGSDLGGRAFEQEFAERLEPVEQPVIGVIARRAFGAVAF